MHLSAIDPLINTAEMTFSEKGIASAKVILTGFVVVFSVLILLICIIKIYSAIVGKAQGAGKKVKKRKVKVPVKPQPDTTTVSVEEEPVVQTDNGSIPEEVIAVISAAVYSVYGGKDKVRIKSVKKSGSRRTAWADAGVRENTRPF